MHYKQLSPKSVGTLIGYAGLFMWSLAALFTAAVESIPTFEILSIVFIISFSVTAIKLSTSKTWHKVLQPWPIWLLGIIGIYGNDVLYVSAFKHAPAVQADLINYLWPILVILFAGLLPKEKLTAKHIVGGLLGFTGTYLIVTGGKGLSGFESQYWQGYLLALLDAIVWSGYSLAARHYGKTPVEMIGMYCGVNAVLSLLTHFSFEPTVIPSGIQWAALVAMGFTTQGAAYFLWDYGIKRGDFKLLSVLSYGNPVLSVGFLILFGLATLSTSLIVACLLVTLGGLVAGLEWQHQSFRKILDNFKERVTQPIEWLGKLTA